jgi:hypothetical protein
MALKPTGREGQLKMDHADAKVPLTSAFTVISRLLRWVEAAGFNGRTLDPAERGVGIFAAQRRSACQAR